MTNSKQARKQRKELFNLPLHKNRKKISAHLSKELKTKYKKRSICLRKGDKVKIMQGEFAGKSGKITAVNLRKQKIKIEKITAKKLNGTEKELWFEPSKVMVTELVLEDKKRIKTIERK